MRCIGGMSAETVETLNGLSTKRGELPLDQVVSGRAICRFIERLFSTPEWPRARGGATALGNFGDIRAI